MCKVLCVKWSFISVAQCVERSLICNCKVLRVEWSFIRGAECVEGSLIII